jgi:hypothetical protein
LSDQQKWADFWLFKVWNDMQMKENEQSDFGAVFSYSKKVAKESDRMAYQS